MQRSFIKNDISFIYSFLLNLPSKKFGLAFKDRYITISIKDRLTNFARHGYAKFFKIQKKRTTSIPENKIWFFVETENQFKAIEPIFLKMEDAIVVTSMYNLNDNSKNIYHLDFFRIGNKIWLFPKYVYMLIKLFGIDIFTFMDYFMYHFGIYEVIQDLIVSKHPKALILSNDHNPMCRSVLLAFKKKNIKTIYIQHASVSHLFPALDFDLALLEGEDSKIKYESLGKTSCQIKLVGIPKYDNYVLNRRNGGSIKTIGIGFNIFDDIMKIFELIVFLNQNHKELYIIIRPHPSDKRDISSLIKLKNVFFSNSVNENSFEFIGKIDILIAGDTSLHLEATMMNVKSLYYNVGLKDIYDYYGFLKNQIIIEMKDKNDIKDYLILHKDGYNDVYHKAAYYNAAIDSDYEGNSCGTAVSLILKEVN